MQRYDLLLVVVLFSGVAAFLIDVWLIRKAESFGLIDMPNSRSSHDRPTPKGGGIGIVVGVFAALSISYAAGVIARDIRYGYIVGGSLAVGLLGFCSDRSDLPPVLRIVVQTLVAALVVFFIGSPTSLTIAGHRFPIGPYGGAIATLWLVAVTNFYNFMDGIDGLAAMQTITAGIGIAVFGMMPQCGSLVPLGLTLAGASTGFLVLNAPPAKIFMGDVGSYFAGFYIASIALLDERYAIPTILLLGIFIFDPVVTLLRRIGKGEPWYRAHRNHLYQRAVCSGYSHSQVTAALSLLLFSFMGAACVYLRSSPPVQAAILGIAFLCCIGLVIQVRSMEKRKRI